MTASLKQSSPFFPLLWLPLLIFPFSSSVSSRTPTSLLSPGFHPGRISEGQFEHSILNGWMSAQKVEKDEHEVEMTRSDDFHWDEC